MRLDEYGTFLRAMPDTQIPSPQIENQSDIAHRQVSLGL